MCYPNLDFLEKWSAKIPWESNLVKGRNKTALASFLKGISLLCVLTIFFLGTSSCAELQYACRFEAGLFTLSHEGYFSTALCFTGAHVTATDLPELLGNLQYNISRNTKMKCKHLPQVKELSWGRALDKNFPRSSNNFDYILAADVVYAHPFLEELLITFDHLCKEATIILWVMKFRLEKENKFVDRFKELFDLEEISSFPSLNIKLYKAMKKNRRSA